MKDARPGGLVQFKGLNGAAHLHLNGQQGRLVKWFKRVGFKFHSPHNTTLV